MLSTPLSMGVRRAPTTPATITVDLIQFATARPAITIGDDSWLDTVANPTGAMTLVGATASAAQFNNSESSSTTFLPATNGVSLLVPGIYVGKAQLELISLVGTTEFGFAVVSAAASPAVFYKEDGRLDAVKIMAINEVRTLTRKFLIDIAEPTEVRFVLVERGGAAGQLKTRGGQFTITRLFDHVTVTRT